MNKSCYMFKDVTDCMNHKKGKCNECDHLIDPAMIPSPMLLSEIPGHHTRIMKQINVYVQPKLNGWRGIANTRTRKLYSRSGRAITTLPHINAALPHDGPEWLDGEFYKHGVSLDKIASMIKQGDAKIEFHVFDCVSRQPFSGRLKMVMDIETNDVVFTVPTSDMEPEGIDDIYNACLNNGYEGIVVRLDGYGYEHGRSINIFKIKPGTEVI